MATILGGFIKMRGLLLDYIDVGGKKEVLGGIWASFPLQSVYSLAKQMETCMPSFEEIRESKNMNLLSLAKDNWYGCKFEDDKQMEVAFLTLWGLKATNQEKKSILWLKATLTSKSLHPTQMLPGSCDEQGMFQDSNFAFVILPTYQSVPHQFSFSLFLFLFFSNKNYRKNYVNPHLYLIFWKSPLILSSLSFFWFSSLKHLD